jgi:hypothetical protein
VVTINLWLLLKIGFWIFWIVGVIALAKMNISNSSSDNFAALGIEMMFKSIFFVTGIIILLLSVLVYGGIFWW